MDELLEKIIKTEKECAERTEAAEREITGNLDRIRKEEEKRISELKTIIADTYNTASAKKFSDAEDTYRNEIAAIENTYHSILQDRELHEKVQNIIINILLNNTCNGE
ncbi:MAG TPA: hypothetical protein PK544_13575 [Spirochaetota bacterium]|nr:hypothetical protein [Spirochaetota bacterium]HPQ54125.1 hypothetical protein [Spirochaetota bacterium]